MQRHDRGCTCCAQVECSLEMSFVMEAEMVFTTLSSTGRRIFQRLEGMPFETVLIDEAAQASEIAALQPLVFGAKRCAHEALLAHSGLPQIVMQLLLLAISLATRISLLGCYRLSQ